MGRTIYAAYVSRNAYRTWRKVSDFKKNYNGSTISHQINQQWNAGTTEHLIYMHADWLTELLKQSLHQMWMHPKINVQSINTLSLIPKAQASGTNTISHLQLIPPTSSSGMASHKTEPHRYATITIPQNLVLENGGWNTENKGILKISRTHCYALTTYIHVYVLTWK